MNWAGERRRERQRWRWRQPPCEAASLSRLKSSEMIYSGTPLLAARPPPSPERAGSPSSRAVGRAGTVYGDIEC